MVYIIDIYRYLSFNWKYVNITKGIRLKQKKDPVKSSEITKKQSRNHTTLKKKKRKTGF